MPFMSDVATFLQAARDAATPLPPPRAVETVNARRWTATASNEKAMVTTKQPATAAIAATTLPSSVTPADDCDADKPTDDALPPRSAGTAPMWTSSTLVALRLGRPPSRTPTTNRRRRGAADRFPTTVTCPLSAASRKILRRSDDTR